MVQDETATIVASYTYTDAKGHKTTLTKSKALTVKAPVLSKLSLSSSKVKNGSSVTVTLTLTGPTAADTTVAVSSSNPAVATPVDASGNPITTVTIPAGAGTARFYVRTYPVALSTKCALSATLGTTRQVTLTVTP